METLKDKLNERDRHKVKEQHALYKEYVQHKDVNAIYHLIR